MPVLEKILRPPIFVESKGVEQILTECPFSHFSHMFFFWGLPSVPFAFPTCAISPWSRTSRLMKIPRQGTEFVASSNSNFWKHPAWNFVFVVFVVVVVVVVVVAGWQNMCQHI